MYLGEPCTSSPSYFFETNLLISPPTAFIHAHRPKVPAKRDTTAAPSLPTAAATTTSEVEKKEEIDEPEAVAEGEEAIVTESIIELTGDGLEEKGGD